MTMKTALLVLTLSLAAGCGGGLPSFGAELGKKVSPVGEVRVPYASVVSYFGYVAPGAPADEIREGKRMFYLYLWIPVAAPEVGVRMLSPVGDLARPTEGGDFVDPLFKERGLADRSNYFDTWVRMERCLTAIGAADVVKPCSQWTSYGDNDDSAELPAQPSGNRHNSVLRVTSTPSDPLRTLVRGLYRIAFTTYKVGEVQGSFLAQVGAPVAMPGAAMARTPVELGKLVAR
jgi:hypothetical protein